MSAIAFDLPEDVKSAVEGVLAFARQEVLPRHEKHGDLLEDGRRKYAEDGRISPEVQQIIREVRMAASDAGFFQMCVPEHLGGGGLGMQAYYAGWQALFHMCGPKNWRMRLRPCSTSIWKT